MIRKATLIALAGALALALFLPQTGLAQRRGGTLNWFVYADPARLDILTETPLAVQQVTAGVYSGLLQFSPDDPGQIVPDLAESWEASKDGKTYTYKLRKGVKWHDGKDFTAEDVKATYDHLLDPKVKARRCGPAVRPILESVEVVNSHTVKLHLKFPTATIVPISASAWCRIMAKHVLEKFPDLQSAEAQIGTGPFKFKRYERGSVIEWVRNDNYYDPSLPYLDGVKQFVLVGEARQVAAAKAGQVHLWDAWPPMTKSSADEIKNARGNAVEVYTWPINLTWELHLNTTKPPFDKKDLRRAVHLALDRQGLIEKAWEGIGTPCAIIDPKLYGDWALPMDEVLKMPGCRPDKTEDLKEAERLVRKHYPDGVEFELVTRTVGSYVDRVQLVAAQLRKVGFKPTIKTYESAAGNAVYGKGEFTAIGVQDTAMYVPDPSGIFSILFTKGAGRNWEKWDDPTVNDLAERALREPNQAKRRELYHKLQRYLLTEDNASPVVNWIDGYYFYDKKLKNYRSANTIYDNNTFMKVWLEQ